MMPIYNLGCEGGPRLSSLKKITYVLVCTHVCVCVCGGRQTQREGDTTDRQTDRQIPPYLRQDHLFTARLAGLVAPRDSPVSASHLDIEMLD